MFILWEEIYEVLLLTTSYKINMEQYINTTDIVEYKENKIDVHWMRNAYKKKTTVRLFPEDDGIVTVEKDYIIFTYKGIEIQDSYESDRYTRDGRVWDICSVIDAGNFDELTKMVTTWRKNKIDCVCEVSGTQKMR